MLSWIFFIIISPALSFGRGICSSNISTCLWHHNNWHILMGYKKRVGQQHKLNDDSFHPHYPEFSGILGNWIVILQVEGGVGTLVISHFHRITLLGSQVICYKNNGAEDFKEFFCTSHHKILFYVHLLRYFT